jgi:hypothetical protein
MNINELNSLKNRIFENIGTKSNKTNLLLERMIITDKNFIVDLKEENNKIFYINKLNESKTKLFNDISEIAAQTNVLTGNYNKDSVFLKESTNLLESGRYDEFVKFVNESLYEVESKPEKTGGKRLKKLTDLFLLSFQAGNSKLYGEVGIFSLPAGWTCPFAEKCLKKVSRDINPETGKVDIVRGKNAEFDCYAANAEFQYVGTRLNRWHNFDLLRFAAEEGGVEAQTKLILDSLEWFLNETKKNSKIKTIRIHESGDFYNLKYLDAWMGVAKARPDLHFYAYTKSIPYVKQRLEQYEDLPNFAITLSEGGKYDDDIINIDVKQVGVYNSPEELRADLKFLDLDDELAMEKGGKEKNFGLLVHGTQKAGTDLAKDKSRNETFAAYWKYRRMLNDFFDLPLNHRMTSDEAETNIKVVNAEMDAKRLGKTKGKFIEKLLKYVIKYNEYNFDPELEQIIPDKYRD